MTPLERAAVKRLRRDKHAAATRLRQEKNRLWKLKILAKRDGMYCGICGRGIASFDDITMDHIIPRSLGGPDGLYNRRLAHRVCDYTRGNTIDPARDVPHGSWEDTPLKVKAKTEIHGYDKNGNIIAVFKRKYVRK